jgi:hypothetical protein
VSSCCSITTWYTYLRLFFILHTFNRQVTWFMVIRYAVRRLLGHGTLFTHVSRPLFWSNDNRNVCSWSVWNVLINGFKQLSRKNLGSLKSRKYSLFFHSIFVSWSRCDCATASVSNIDQRSTKRQFREIIFTSGLHRTYPLLLTLGVKEQQPPKFHLRLTNIMSYHNFASGIP